MKHPRILRWITCMGVTLILVLATGVIVVSSVSAQPAGYLEIVGSPLTIQVGSNASIQVYHQNYTHGATYGSGDSGFFLAIGDNIYGPDTEETNEYSIGPTTLKLELISNQGPLGSGSSAEPYRIVTTQRLVGDGAVLGVVQTTSYINGKQFFQLQWQITNNGSGESCFKAYHAADIYFADDDLGYGYYNAATGSVGGFNKGRDWFMVFTPLTPAEHYQEDHFGIIWYRVESKDDFEDTIDNEYSDNGIGLQWNRCLPAGQTITLGDRWSFGESESAVLGIPGGFRNAGPLVPEITTYIPTPLDVSTQPGVVGTNLLLAAFLMLPFALAAEFFTRTLAENEEILRRRIKPVDWIARLEQNIEKRIGAHLKKSVLVDIAKLLGVMLFYGLVFSLLDRTWNPFSLKGLVLFFSMTIAYGLVGIADDILQWRVIRKWGLPANLTVRPTNFLLAIVSTFTSRIISLVPGLMFGTPEALHTDEERFNESQRNTLLKISAITFTSIGLVVWLPTIATGLLQKISLPEIIGTFIGGLEAFLLVVFAVAMENTFVQMLGFTGGFGKALKKKNRWLWFGALIGVVFIFLHTLLNPRGELAAALQEGNVLLFLGVVVAFVIFTFGMRIYFRIRNPHTAEGTIPVLPATSVPAVSTQPIPLRTAVTAIPFIEAEKVPVITTLGGEKQCPICCNTIKAQATLCRFCRATFTVTLKGYCLTDHKILGGTDAGKCIRCGDDLADLHVESRLLQAPSVRPTRIAAEKLDAPVIVPVVETTAQTDTKHCPSCGQTIKAEAKICRYCRARLDAPPPEPAIVEPLPKKSELVMEMPGPQACPKCSGSLSERKGSPISPYINTYTCSKCGWRGFKCGKTDCDGYLKPQEAGYPNSVRYNCVKCGWTGMGARVGL